MIHLLTGIITVLLDLFRIVKNNLKYSMIVTIILSLPLFANLFIKV